MMKKLKNFKECVEELKQVDQHIYRELEDENYSEVVVLLNKRLTIIGMINQIKKKEALSETVKEEFVKVFKDSVQIEQKIADMMDKIRGRLKNRRQVKSINRKIAY